MAALGWATVVISALLATAVAADDEPAFACPVGHWPLYHSETNAQQSAVCWYEDKPTGRKAMTLAVDRSRLACPPCLAVLHVPEDAP